MKLTERNQSISHTLNIVSLKTVLYSYMRKEGKKIKASINYPLRFIFQHTHTVDRGTSNHKNKLHF